MQTNPSRPFAAPHRTPLGSILRTPTTFRGYAKVATPEDVAKARSPQTQMAVAMGLTGRHFYEGTVPAAVVQKRRRRNKLARAARRAHR